MKTKLLIASTGLLLASVGVANAMSMMEQVKVDSNVRSSAMMTNNHIGNLKKGEMVNALGQKGKWCQVGYKQYKSAYVWCANLMPAMNAQMAMPMHMDMHMDMPASNAAAPNMAEKPLVLKMIDTHTQMPVQPSGVNAISQLRDLQSWLMNDGEKGKKYINESLDQGNQMAIKWSSDAMLYKTDIKFPAQFGQNNYCSFYWTAKSKPNLMLETQCFDLTSNMINSVSKTYDGVNASSTVTDPKLKLSGLVGQMLNSESFMARIKGKFASNPMAATYLHFVLTSNNGGEASWNFMVHDNGGGIQFSATSSANTEAASF